MPNPVLPAVVEILSELFAVPPESLTFDSSMETVEKWDSLQHLNVVFDVEQKFGLEFSPEEVLELNSVRKIVEIVERKVASKTG